MSLLNRLIEQLAKRGLTVQATDDPNTLLLCGPKEEQTPELWAAVKKFKPQLLERYGRKEQKRQAEVVKQEAAKEGLVVEDD